MTYGVAADLRASQQLPELPSRALVRVAYPLTRRTQSDTGVALSAVVSGASACDIALVRRELVSGVDDSVTGLIHAWGAGDSVAGDRLFARVYTELRTIARRLHGRLARTNGDDTLDTTALVHEVYLRLASAGELRVENRAHFFAVAVRASRQIVSNYARHAQAAKRGGGAPLASLDSDSPDVRAVAAVSADAADRIAALDDALVRLEHLHPRPCRVVECRYFGGLSIAETAAALNLSEATVKRDWAVAQAWLFRELRDA